MISNLTKQFLEKFTNELKQPKNIKKIKNNVLDPLIQYTTLKLYPYFLIIVILFLIISLFSLINFFILLKILLKKNINT